MCNNKYGQAFFFFEFQPKINIEPKNRPQNGNVQEKMTQDRWNGKTNYGIQILFPF